MKIKRLIVEKLYGVYNYDVLFNSDITFLYGENGCGKTTILNITGAIVTGKLYLLFDYDFKSVELIYGVSESIMIVHKGDSLEITYGIRDKRVQQNLPNNFEEFCKQKNSNIHIATIKYMETYPFLKKICEIFNYVYLPLDRSYKLDVCYGEELGFFGSLYSMYRFDELGKNQDTNISIMQISEMIFDKYNIINRNLAIINNQFRDSILQSFSEIYDIKDATRLIKDIFSDKEQTVKKVRGIQSAYVNILKDLNILNRINLNKYENFFEEFIKDLNSIVNNKNINKRQGFEKIVTLLIKLQELNRLDGIIKFANDIEKKKEKVKKPLEDFLSIVNSFIGTSSTKKEIKLSRDGKPFLSVNDKKRIDIKYLSSGEKQIVIFFAYLILNLKQGQNGIFIVDEPEMSLHLYWQKIFVDKIIEANPNIQILFATHAPEIIGRRRDKMVKLVRQ